MKIVDFTIRKQHFRSSCRIGPPSEPSEPKKKNPKGSYSHAGKKAAPKQRFFNKKETLLLEGAFLSGEPITFPGESEPVSQSYVGIAYANIAEVQNGNLYRYPSVPWILKFRYPSLGWILKIYASTGVPPGSHPPAHRGPTGVPPGGVSAVLRLLHPHLWQISANCRDVRMRTISRNGGSFFENEHF